MGESRLINRNINATVGRTSMRLEPEFWDALAEICRRESLVQAELIREIEQGSSKVSRTSAVRVHILQYFRAAAANGFPASTART